ncbi:MAG: ABC transporter permease subunit [Caldilineaceae bacterium]
MSTGPVCSWRCSWCCWSTPTPERWPPSRRRGTSASPGRWTRWCAGCATISTRSATRPLGTGPFSDFVTIYLLNPLRSLLQTWLPWPVVMAGVGVLCYFAGGWRLALFGAAGLFLIGLMGLWDAAMDTLSQVLVATLSRCMGIPLGIWAARNDRARALLRPILDFLQTIPAFVYLVPVIMLFNVGRSRASWHRCSTPSRR